MKEGIRIIVCLKQVTDPEAPAASFKIIPEAKKIVAEGVPPVISPYDESALELALKIKDARADVRIAAVSLGPKLARPVLMKALAVGADELYLVEGQVQTDTRMTSAILASVISKMNFDLILAGRQAADTNAGGVGLALAVRLNIPAVAWARKIDVDDKGLTVERVLPDGYERLRGPMPALVTVSHEAGSLRMPKLQDIKRAKEKPLHNITVTELDTSAMPAPAVNLINLKSPSRERNCFLVEAENPAEAGTKLAQKLIEDAVLAI